MATLPADAPLVAAAVAAEAAPEVEEVANPAAMEVDWAPASARRADAMMLFEKYMVAVLVLDVKGCF